MSQVEGGVGLQKTSRPQSRHGILIQACNAFQDRQTQGYDPNSVCVAKKRYLPASGRWRWSALRTPEL